MYAHCIAIASFNNYPAFCIALLRTQCCERVANAVKGDFKSETFCSRIQGKFCKIFVKNALDKFSDKRLHNCGLLQIINNIG